MRVSIRAARQLENIHWRGKNIFGGQTYVWGRGAEGKNIPIIVK